jgi:hypothetical protein
MTREAGNIKEEANRAVSRLWLLGVLKLPSARDQVDDDDEE